MQGIPISAGYKVERGVNIIENGSNGEYYKGTNGGIGYSVRKREIIITLGLLLMFLELQT